MRPIESLPLLLFISTISLGSLGACGKVTLGSGDADAGADSAPEVDSPGPSLCTGDVALENAWQCTTDVVCGLISECFGESYTVQDCQQLDLEIFDINHRYGELIMLSAIEAGTVTYDGQDLGRCLDSISALTCAEIFTSNDPFEMCGGFVGNMGVNEPCVFDGECALPGSTCEQPGCTGEDVCCFGQCSDVAPVGGMCANGIECEPGAYCVDGACWAGQPGDRCNGDFDCDAFAHCANNICMADYPPGAQCSDDDQCVPPTTCVGENTPGIIATCEASMETGDLCDGSCSSSATHYCDRPETTVLGNCLPRLGVGEACSPELMPCEIGLRCDTGTLTCVAYGGEGEPCQNSLDCAYFKGTFCSTDIDSATEGTCWTRQPDDAACTDGRHCQSGICQQNRCTPAQACY